MAEAPEEAGQQRLLEVVMAPKDAWEARHPGFPAWLHEQRQARYAERERRQAERAAAAAEAAAAAGAADASTAEAAPTAAAAEGGRQSTGMMGLP